MALSEQEGVACGVLGVRVLGSYSHNCFKPISQHSLGLFDSAVPAGGRLVGTLPHPHTPTL